MNDGDLTEALRFWEMLEGVGFNESDTPERLAAYLRRNPGMSLVARSDGELVGAVLCGHDGRRGYLQHLAVAPEFRRKGIGKALIKGCLTRLAALDIQKCNIFVYENNEEGRQFWQRNGWRQRHDLNVMQHTIA